MKKIFNTTETAIKTALSIILIILIILLAINRATNTKIYTNDKIDKLLNESTEVTPAEFGESGNSTYTRTTIVSDDEETAYIYRVDMKESKQTTLNQPMRSNGSVMFSVRSKANNRVRYYFQSGGRFWFEGINTRLVFTQPAIMNDTVLYDSTDINAHIIKNGDTVIVHRNAKGAIIYIVDGSK